MQYDYIVIGAGSAGCAVAARLSERGESTVLLLEAGGPDEDQNIHVPVAFPLLFRTPVDWAYETEPQRYLNGRREYVPRGRVFGGSSSINAMVYQRGNAANYDAWAAMGNHGWSWRDVLPYFKRAQHQERGRSELHAVGGAVNVADLRDPSLLSRALVEAAAEAGYPVNTDFNGESQEGFGLYQVTQKDGRRHSAAAAYLHPALARENLTAVPHAQVERLTFEGLRCTGAVWRKDGETRAVTAAGEVVLCAGAINSPQLLMLSGIGAGEALERLGIETVADLPGVGRNLQDHLMCPVAYHCTQSITLTDAASDAELARFRQGRGMLTSNVGEAGGFVKLDPRSAAPELQFHFAPTWFVRHGAANPPGHGFTLLPAVVGSKSVGHVTLRSADPQDPPVIDPNYLAVEEDAEVLVEGVKIARRILNAAPFDAYRGDEHLPGSAVRGDGDLREFVRGWAQTLYHPVGTCKMGSDPMAVVDDRLRVHGVQGLRVADASIMPVIINANTNAPSMMIGEKCADLILRGE